MYSIYSQKTTKKNDIFLLEKVLQVCSVFGILPFYSITKCSKKFYYFYMFCLVIHLLGIFVLGIFAYYFFYDKHISAVGRVLTIFELSTNGCFALSCIFTVLKKRDSLREIMEYLSQFDRNIDTKWFVAATPIYFRIWIYHIIPVFIVTNKFFNNAFTADVFVIDCLNVTYTFLLIYMKFLFMVVTKVMAQVFEERYNILELELQLSLCHRELLNRTENNAVNKLRKLFYLLQVSIEKLDDIFGLPILVLVMNACAGTLTSFNYILFYKRSGRGEDYWKMLQLCVQALVSIFNI